MENYNQAEIEYEIDNDYLVVDLTYNISGVVLCGENLLSGVEVTAGNTLTTTDTNGSFMLEGLKGEATIEFNKDYYNIATYNITDKIVNNDITIKATYYIEGLVTDSAGEAITNFTIILVDNNTNRRIWKV